jgi:hypothetical protein
MLSGVQMRLYLSVQITYFFQHNHVKPLEINLAAIDPIYPAPRVNRLILLAGELAMNTFMQLSIIRQLYFNSS